MVINALNSGAQVFMADFEDSNAPSWRNQVEGQANLADAVRRSISFEDPRSGKKYALGPDPAVLFVRPRGWHLPESHFVVDGKPVPGALFDFGMYFFHNARGLVSRGSGPYFYLPKMQSHLEARLWNEVFLDAQHALGIPSGTIKATCLIETLPGELLFFFFERSWRAEEEEEEETKEGVRGGEKLTSLSLSTSTSTSNTLKKNAKPPSRWTSSSSSSASTPPASTAAAGTTSSL